MNRRTLFFWHIIKELLLTWTPLLLLFFGIWLSYYGIRIRPIVEVRIDHHGILNQYGIYQVKANTTTLVHTYQKQSAPAIAHTISLQAPYINHSTIEIIPFHGIYADLTMHVPLAYLNNEQILLTNGAIVVRSWFNNNRIGPIPLITIDPEIINDNLISDAIPLITNIHTLFKNHYSITIQDKNTVWLTDTNSSWYSICMGMHTIIDQKMISALSYVKKDLEQKKKASNRVRDVWVIDVRFKDQIVVYTK